MTNDPPAPTPVSELTWSCVEDGFYVASRDGEFVGFVDRIDLDSFQVCNAGSQQLGFFRDLDSAMRCLTRLDHAATDGANESDLNGKVSLEDAS